MRNLSIATAALALVACTNTTAANETDAIDNGAGNVALADNGTVANEADNAILPPSGGATAALKTADRPAPRIVIE